MPVKGILINLISQFERIYKHNRQGSILTKRRYREAFLRLLAYLAEEFRIEKISNIAPKHVFAYVARLIEKGCTPGYVKTEMSAIRFWHDKIPDAKYQIPSNDDLGLDRRQYGGVDRTWSPTELARAQALAVEQDHENYLAVFSLARYAGLRLHECFRMNTRDAELALKTGTLTVTGKGGLRRQVPTTPEIDAELRKVLAVTPRGGKLFVAVDDKTHLAMLRLERFLYDHKAEIQDAGSTRPLSFHGLRHCFSVEKYKEFIAQGMTAKQARMEVAKLLGHGRDSVTKIYLASLDSEDRG